MQLYQREDCPFCWKIRLILSETGIPCDIVSAPAPGDLTPQSTVPVLLDGALAIWESSVIAEYLCDLAPGVGLLPTDLSSRARTRLLHTYSDRIAGLGLRDVIFEKRQKPEAEWDLQKIENGIERWEKTLDWLECELGDDPYFGGARFTIADCALVPRFALAQKYGVPLDPDRRTLNSWVSRVFARESFAATEPRVKEATL